MPRNKKAVSTTTQMAQRLNEREAGAWQEDLDWLRTQLPCDGQPGSALIRTLMKRHGEPTDEQAEQLIAWCTTSSPYNTEKLRKDPIRFQHALEDLTKPALQSESFTWVVWLIGHSDDPASTIKRIGMFERDYLPFAHRHDHLDPGQRQAWNTLWWWLAEHCGTWDSRIHSFFSLGLHEAWPWVEVDRARLGRVFLSAQDSAEQLRDWPKSEEYRATLSDMKRKVLEDHIHGEDTVRTRMGPRAL